MQQQNLLRLHETTFSRLTDVRFSNGGFPLWGNFYVRRRVKFTCVKKIEAMYGRSCVNVKVEPRLTLTCTRGLSNNSSISVMQGKNTRQWKSTLRESCLLPPGK